MLWEPDDPTTVLAQRFGFADVLTAERWLSRTVQQHWEIDVVGCDRFVMSFKNVLAWIRTPQGPMLAKWSIAAHRFDRLAALADVTAWLDQRGYPVSAPVPTPDGQRQVEVDGVSFGLQRQIDGALLDVTEPKQVYAAGTALARLHETFSSYPDADRIPGISPQTETLTAQISSWLEDGHPRDLADALDVLRRRLADAPAVELPTQLLLGDFRAANVLLDAGAVTAVLDFEEAGFGHRIEELARSAVLLGTRFHDWGPVTPAVRATYLDGYQSVCRLTPAEAAWWDTLVLWFSLAMVPDGDDPTGWGTAAAHLATASDG